MRNIDESAPPRVHVTGDRKGFMGVHCELYGEALCFETDDERAAIEMTQAHLSDVHPGIPHPGPYLQEQAILDAPRPCPEEEARQREAARRSSEAYARWKQACRGAHPRRQVTQAEYEQMRMDETLDPGVRYDVVYSRHEPRPEPPRPGIADLLSRRYRHAELPGLPQMLDVLAWMDATTPPGTRVDLADGLGWITVEEFMTKDPKQMAGLEESGFAEVHVVLEGVERIDVVNVDARASLGDEEFASASPAVRSQALTLRPGWFVGFFP